MKRFRKILLIVCMAAAVLFIPVSAMASSNCNAGKNYDAANNYYTVTSCSNASNCDADNNCGDNACRQAGYNCYTSNCSGSDTYCDEDDACFTGNCNTLKDCGQVSSCDTKDCDTDTVTVTQSNAGYNSLLQYLQQYLQNINLQSGSGGQDQYDFLNLFDQLTTTNGSCAAKQGLSVQPTKTVTGNPTRQTTPTYDNDEAALDELTAEVLRLVNIERANEGLDPLVADAAMCQAAEVRAQEIISTFSHTRPDGSSCFTALDQAGVRYNMAGENIAIGQTSAASVVQAWMNSPGHRANIMNSSYSRIGLAAKVSTGTYGGYAWAQFFAD